MIYQVTCTLEFLTLLWKGDSEQAEECRLSSYADHELVLQGQKRVFL